MSQDNFYSEIEAEAFFQRNFHNFDAKEVAKNLWLRENKQSIYSFLSSGISLEALSVLEIGCSVGDLLLVLERKHGCKVMGIEPSRSAAAIARSAFGLDVVTSTFVQSELFDLDSQNRDKYDLLILDDVVGWMEPKYILPTIGVLDWILKPEGYIFVRELYSAHSVKVRNHHHETNQIFNYRYGGGISKLFTSSGMYYVARENTWPGKSLQKVDASLKHSVWRDSILQHSPMDLIPEIKL